MTISIRPEAFFPYLELENHQRRSQENMGTFGATASFVGTMRDSNEGDSVIGMYLEHYPGMTEKHLLAIESEARNQWALLDSLVIHRVGEVVPGETIVLVAVWAAHRGDAFDACRFITEELKARAPFWKREFLAEGTRWLARNTAGYADQAGKS